MILLDASRKSNARSTIKVTIGVTYYQKFEEILLEILNIFNNKEILCNEHLPSEY